MSETPIERDESGRFVKPDIDARPPDLEQDYYPLALTLFGWTRSARLPLIAIVMCVAVLLCLLVLSAGNTSVSSSGLTDITGFYAGAGLVATFAIILLGSVTRQIFGRGPDYYGEEDTQPDDVEERS
ncbi:MAG: hypothetical protein AAGH90_01465 [Pseudomonadota bacterium]